MSKPWTAEEDALVRCLIARGPAIKGAWAALGPILGRSEASCYARGRHLRNAAGNHVKGIGANKAKPVKKTVTSGDSLFDAQISPAPSFRRPWWKSWRKH